MSDAIASAAPEELVRALRTVYDGFSEETLRQADGGEGESLVAALRRWFNGRGNPEREKRCEEFAAGMEQLLEQLQTALKDVSPEKAQDVCAELAEILLQPRPARSTSAVDLMKRSMAARLVPFLPYLKRENLEGSYRQFCSNYKKRDRFPVENQLVREMERLLTQR